MDELLAGLTPDRLLLGRRRLLGGGAAAFAASFVPRPARADSRDDILVIGAGLSGLNAALILASEGARVTVLEADSRPGGRIRTLDAAPGRPDAGGSEVGPLYARTRSLAGDLGLGLYAADRLPPGMAIHSNNRLLAPAAWAQDPANTLPAPMRAIPPYAVETAMVSRAAPLADAEAWLSPEAAALDIPYDRMLRQLGANDAALACAAVGAQADSLSEISALWMLRRDQGRRQSADLGRVEHIKGGMSRLTDAMAAKLGDAVHFNTEIMAITESGGLVTAHARDGRRFSAARLIVTTPASITRRMVFDPLPPTGQRAAWAHIPYGQATSAFFPITDPFWDQDGLPPSLWSDSLPGRAFVIANDAGRHLWFYATGGKANALHRAAAAEVPEIARRLLVAARPSLDGRLGPGTAFSWTRHPWSLGTFASRRPGHLAILQSLLKRPHGRISFAGEHTADLASGIEGALESGERAALNLLS
ncbi:flavin monoamine oxidase family protein [Polymorphobacter sp.]|uniref:flavin monoamine oxidase family protein n=1 Tax=Polymorphobacter sp. TaxID=1909290 RepID=UPI003F6EE1C2